MRRKRKKQWRLRTLFACSTLVCIVALNFGPVALKVNVSDVRRRPAEDDPKKDRLSFSISNYGFMPVYYEHVNNSEQILLSRKWPHLEGVFKEGHQCAVWGQLKFLETIEVREKRVGRTTGVGVRFRDIFDRDEILWLSLPVGSKNSDD